MNTHTHTHTHTGYLASRGAAEHQSAESYAHTDPHTHTHTHRIINEDESTKRLAVLTPTQTQGNEIPQKRKRGRPRKNPLPHVHSHLQEASLKSAVTHAQSTAVGDLSLSTESDPVSPRRRSLSSQKLSRNQVTLTHTERRTYSTRSRSCFGRYSCVPQFTSHELGKNESRSISMNTTDARPCATQVRQSTPASLSVWGDNKRGVRSRLGRDRTVKDTYHTHAHDHTHTHSHSYLDKARQIHDYTDTYTDTHIDRLAIYSPKFDRC